MRSLTRILAAVLVAPLIYLIACHDATTPSTQAVPAAVETLRQALAPYSSLSLAKGAGYKVAITDCMSNGDHGAMGVHFGNPDLIDATIDSLHPEALIFEPGTNGEMSLVGVEFIVPFAVRPRSSMPPSLFGQSFAINDVFQVWALHVWTHRVNPRGLFAPWNPRVHC